MTPAIEIRSLWKTYETAAGTFNALRELDLTVARGEFVTLLGPSGAGKSTLLRCINGLVAASSGSVKVNGLSVADVRGLHAIRCKTGMIFQHYNLVKRLSVLQNVLCGRLSHNGTLTSLLRLFPRSDVDLSMSCLERVGLADKAHNRADQLSGGQQQRVGIARALAQQPDLILADEPVSSLDPCSARGVLELLHDINVRDGLTIIASLHNMQLAVAFGSRVIGMRHGRLCLDSQAERLDEGTLHDLYASGEEGDD